MYVRLYTYDLTMYSSQVNNMFYYTQQRTKQQQQQITLRVVSTKNSKVAKLPTYNCVLHTTS